MATSATYPDQVASQSRMIQALNEVAALEQGIILNDHYDLSKYVLRRATYLGNNSLYKNLSINWFSIARSDAAEVFDAQSRELSVQEVRRRELRKEIAPLLPLPTTANTETIDSFQSFQQVEWTSEEQIQGQTSKIFSTSTQVNSSSAAPTQARMQTSLESSPPSVPQHSTFNPRPTHPVLRAINGLGQAANTTMAFNGPQQTGQGRLFDMSSSPLPDISFSSPFAIDPRLTADTSLASMEDNGTPMQLDDAETQPPPDPELLRKIINKLGEKPPSNATTAAKEQARASKDDAPKVPQNVYYAEGVSALGNRGMSLPVKTNKRARNDTPDPSDESNQNEDGSGSSEDARPPVSKRSNILALKVDKAKLRSVTSAPPKMSRKKASAGKPKTKPNHIDSVNSGNALPRTAAEATSAADTRLARLLASHNTSMKARKRRSVPAGEEPDFMPEYFNVKKFPKAKRNDQVRCACGVVVDDGVSMIACDKCGVWQHEDCMGEGVPEDLKSEQYFCHVCEPWVHRELVARLRRENPLA